MGVGQYGTSPNFAMFQGFLVTVPSRALVTRAAKNCTASLGGSGEVIVALNTPAVPSEESVDDLNFLAQVQQYGEILEVNIAYATPAPNTITFTFLTDPVADDLFSIVIYQCSDGLTNTGLIADV